MNKIETILYKKKTYENQFLVNQTSNNEIKKNSIKNLKTKIEINLC
jgi:hypothetical protein